MIEFLNLEKMYYSDKIERIKINDVEFDVKIRPLSHLFEFRLIKLYEELIRCENNTDLTKYLEIIDLGVQENKELVFKFIWEKYKEKDLFTYLYTRVLEEIIISYYQVMQDERTQEYLRIGETKRKEKEDLNPEKPFNELFLELMEIKEENISLYGANMLLHFRRRNKAREGVENISQIYTCLIELLEIYCRKDTKDPMPTRVRDLMNDYKRMLGVDKPIYRRITYFQLADMDEEANNGSRN